MMAYAARTKVDAEIELSLKYADVRLGQLAEDIQDLATRLGRKRDQYDWLLRDVMRDRRRLAEATSPAAQRSAVAES